MDNHYDWLERNFQAFLLSLGIQKNYRGLIVAHGDKCYGYKKRFEEAGISFEKGVAIYLLTYIFPFSEEVRETQNGFVSPVDWIIKNKEIFLFHLEVS